MLSRCLKGSHARPERRGRAESPSHGCGGLVMPFKGSANQGILPAQGEQASFGWQELTILPVVPIRQEIGIRITACPRASAGRWPVWQNSNAHFEMQTNSLTSVPGPFPIHTDPVKGMNGRLDHARAEGVFAEAEHRCRHR